LANTNLLKLLATLSLSSLFKYIKLLSKNYIFFLFNNINKMNFNMGEIVKRAIKYLVEGLMVAIVAFVIPQKPLKMEEIAIIALMAAATFSILDTFIPSMGVSARSGAGFGIGANLVGFPRIG